MIVCLSILAAIAVVGAIIYGIVGTMEDFE